jgi:polar amino acid transport system substrate-binding protein
MRTRFQSAAIGLIVVLVAAACGSAGATAPAKTPVPTLAAGPTPVATPVPPETIAPTEAATPVPTLAETPAATETAAATTEATPPETVAPSPSVLPTISADCMKGTVGTKNPGRLTLSTDTPAYPPWWGGDPKTQYPNEPAGGDHWKVSDPYSQMGYEGATAYAVAAALGFAPEDVDWIQNTVFANAFKPGPKDFDFHLAQISIRPKRALNVDFSDPYFDSNQAIVSLKKASDGSPNPILSVTTIAGLKPFKLGAAVGTTSYDLIQNVIQPDQQASVFDDNSAALQALQNGQIDGLVTDLYSGFYMRDVQLTGGTIVGQFDVSAQTDQMGLVLELGSSLTACIDEALAVIKANGTLATIYDTWISTGQSVPFFQ